MGLQQFGDHVHIHTLAWSDDKFIFFQAIKVMLFSIKHILP